MQVSKILRKSTVGYTFFCPGCKTPHSIYTHGEMLHARWAYNDNHDKPTFEPSLDCRTCGAPDGTDRCLTEDEEKEYDTLYATAKAAGGEEHARAVLYSSKFGRHCHSFIRDGMIQFLDDCTHHLRGQTVPIPPLPPHMQNDNWRD